MQSREPVAFRLPDPIRRIPEEHRTHGWEQADEQMTVMFDAQRSVVVDFEDGRSRTMTGEQLRDYVFNPANRVCITANGTLFRTDKEGIIPLLLAKWYSERKQMQGWEKDFAKAAEEGVAIDAELASLIG